VNILLIPCFFYSFLVALCMKFDGMIDTSIFILLIPLWVIILPLFIFVVINGLATKNSRANKCEKLTVSLMVPCKLFLIRLIYLNYRRFLSLSDPFVIVCRGNNTQCETFLPAYTLFREHNLFIPVHALSD
jgi:hypothetical protein